MKKDDRSRRIDVIVNRLSEISEPDKKRLYRTRTNTEQSRMIMTAFIFAAPSRMLIQYREGLMAHLPSASLKLRPCGVMLSRQLQNGLLEPFGPTQRGEPDRSLRPRG
jgi:hypothetical protein